MRHALLSGLLSTTLLLGCAAGGLLSGLLLKQHAGPVWNTPSAAAGLLDRMCASAAAWGFECEPAHRTLDTLPVPGIRRDASGFDLHWASVPTAFVGLAYFLGLALWFLIVGPPRHAAPWVTGVPLVILLCGALGSLTLLVHMAASGQPACVACVGVHVLNMALLGLTLTVHLRRRRPSTPAPAARPSSPVRPALVAGVLSAAAISGAWIHYSDQVALRGQVRRLLTYRAFVRQLQSDPAFLLREFDAQPQSALTAPRDTPGPHLVVFTDYSCGACRCQWRDLATEVQPLFDVPLTIEVRHFPRPGRERAAAVAEAARQLGGLAAFERAHSALFERHGDVSSESLPDLARICQVDIAALEAAVESDTVRDRVAADTALARALQVRGTPALFLDGRPLGQLLQTPVFWSAYAARAKATMTRVAAAPATMVDPEGGP